MLETSLLNRYLQTVNNGGRLKVYFIYSTLVAFLISMIINQALKGFVPIPFLSHLSIALIYSYSITLWVHLLTSLHFCFCTSSCSAKEKFEQKGSKSFQDIAKVIIMIILTQAGVIVGTIQVFIIRHYLGSSLMPHHSRVNEFSSEHLFKTLGFSLVISTIILIGAFFYERLRLRFEYTMEVLKEKEIQQVEINRLKTEAELSALQAKINPHFLFNTLNSIASLISIDPPRAERAVEKLSHLFRLTLNHSLKKEVKLEESLKTVESYLELEQMRLGSRLTYNINVEGDISQTFIPGLIIQPIVENAIKYGITPSIEGGFIEINVKICDDEKDFCRIEVRNSGAPWSEKSSDSGHGLVNIEERLNLLYGKNWKLEIVKESPVSVKFKIPHKFTEETQDV